jgi:hypothetical protein
LNQTMRARTSAPLSVAIFALSAVAGIATFRLRDATEREDEPVWSAAPPPEPVRDPMLTARSAREPAPPVLPARTIFYEVEGAWALPRGVVSGHWRRADIDLVHGTLIGAEFDGPFHDELAAAQVATLHRLTALSCEQRWDPPAHCTDPDRYELVIDDGDCTLHLRGTCPAHGELIAAIMSAAGWYPFPRGR